MKQNKLLAFILVTTLFMSTAHSSTNLEGAYWTWSDSIKSGDQYQWYVSYYVNGTPSTSGDNQSLTVSGNIPFVDNSYFTIDVTDQPQAYNASAMTPEQYNATFALHYNDILLPSNEIVPIFLSPSVLEWNNGTSMNYFEYLNQTGQYPQIFAESSQGGTYDIQDGIYHFTYTSNNQDSYNSWDMHYDMETGLVQSFSFYSYDGTTDHQVIISLINQSENIDFTPFSFSSDLHIGDTFIWDVLNYEANGTLVTQSNEDVPLVNGSEIKIEIVGNPANLNLTDENVNPEDYFAFSLDGVSYQIKDVFDGPTSFFQFIFPVIYTNGTQQNYFDLVATGNQDFILGEDTIQTSLSNDVFSATDANSNDYGAYSIQSQWNATTGVMQYYKVDSDFTYPNQAGVNVSESTHLEVQLRNTTPVQADNATSSIGLGISLPYANPIWFSIPVIAIPILRKYRKN